MMNVEESVQDFSFQEPNHVIDKWKGMWNLCLCLYLEECFMLLKLWTWNVEKRGKGIMKCGKADI